MDAIALEKLEEIHHVGLRNVGIAKVIFMLRLVYSNKKVTIYYRLMPLLNK